MTTAATDRSPRRFKPADEYLALVPEALSAEHVSVWGGSAWDPTRLFTLDTETGVAEVSVSGPLDPRAFWFFDGYAGDTGVEARAFAAFHDARVRAVVLRLDSPGGACSGLFECCDAIRAMRASTGKPLVAFAEGSGAYSAAYALAATADEVHVSRTAGVGSIGVIATAVSYAGQLEKEGIAVAVVASGAQKTDLHPALPLGEAAVKRLRARVMELASLFFAEVGTSRGMSPDDVGALQAGCFYGEAAVASGLADRVSTVTEAGARARALADQKAAKAAKEQSMSALREALGLTAEATDADIEAKASRVAKVLAAVAAQLGTKDEDAIAPALAAVLTNANRAEALGAENATLRVAAEKVALAADASARAEALEAGRKAGRITPADDADPAFQAMVAGIATAQLPAFVARLRVAVPTSAHAPAHTGQGASAALSDDEKEFARRAGLTHEQFAAQKRADAAQKGL